MSTFQVKYPLDFEQGGTSLKKSFTDKDKSSGRLRFLLSFRPGQRPWLPSYGTSLDDLIQTSSELVVNDTLLRFRNSVTEFLGDYLEVDSFGLQREEISKRLVNINVNYRVR